MEKPCFPGFSVLDSFQSRREDALRGGACNAAGTATMTNCDRAALEADFDGSAAGGRNAIRR